MKKILLIVTIALSALFVSCEKQQDWGLKKIYMPQAAINNSISNDYNVPMSGQKDNNYLLEGDKLNVFLGVYCSGQGNLQEYSVDVYYDALASTDKASGKVLLAEEYFTIPSTINVPSGERQATFYMTIDLAKLKAEHPEYKTEQLVAVIGIKNPSKFELNEEISKTTVVIDASKFIK